MSIENLELEKSKLIFNYEKRGKMNPLISVIIPIYNVEKYLKRCLESVVNQDYKNLEIILINDGSTDNSLEIATTYKSKDKRIKIFSQINQGLSAARNSGLDKATGDYITFIDSDDYVSKDYVSYLFNLIKKNNFRSSFAIASLMDVFETSGRKISTGNNKEYTWTGKQCIEKMCYQDLVDTCAYAKLGTRELYKNFRFPVGKVFEDIGSTYQLFEESPTVECGFKPIYFYNIRRNSITTDNFSKRKLDLLEMTDKMAADVIKHYPDLEPATIRRQVYARFSTLNQTLNAENTSQMCELRKNLISYIKKNKKNVLSNPNIPKRDRIAYKSLKLGLPFYKLTWLVYSKLNK